MTDNSTFMYNGITIYNIGFSDFMLITMYIQNPKSRLLSKNIQSDAFRDRYKKSREFNYGVHYNGVIIDLREINK